MQKRKKTTGSWRTSGRLTIGLVCAVGLLPLAAHAQNAAYNQTALVALCQISAAGTSGRFDTAEQLFSEGKDAGLSALQMYEAVLNLLPYIGYPRTLSTLIRFQQVYPDYIRPAFPRAESAADRTLAGVRPDHLGRTRDADSRATHRRQRGEQNAYPAAQSAQS